MEYKSGAVRPVESISEGLELIRSDYWTFFGITLVTLICVIVLSMILGFINNAITAVIAGVFGVATQNAGDIGKASAAVVPQLISAVIGIFTNLIVVTISGMFACGIYAALARKADTGTANFGDLAKGFEKFMPCLIAGIITSIIQFVIAVVMLLGGAAVGISAFGLGSLIGSDGQMNQGFLGGFFIMILLFAAVYLIISLIIGALSMFVYPLISDRNLSGVEAFLLSVKSGFSNLVGLVLLLILTGLMVFAGALVCLIGALFVAPIMYAAWFVAYRDVFGKLSDFRQYTPPPPPTFQQPGY